MGFFPLEASFGSREPRGYPGLFPGREAPRGTQPRARFPCIWKPTRRGSSARALSFPRGGSSRTPGFGRLFPEQGDARDESTPPPQAVLVPTPSPPSPSSAHRRCARPAAVDSVLASCRCRHPRAPPSPSPSPSPRRRLHGLPHLISAASPSIRDCRGPPRRQHVTAATSISASISIQVSSKIQI